MSKVFRLFPFVFLCFLSACNSSEMEWKNALTKARQQCDSTTFELKQISVEQLNFQEKRAERLFLVVQHLTETDTFSLEEGEKLDAFITAYKNAKGLTLEIPRHQQANKSCKQQIEALQSDIETGNGDRVNYSQHVKHETQQAATILASARLVSEKAKALETSLSNFEPLVNRKLDQ